MGFNELPLTPQGENPKNIPGAQVGGGTNRTVRAGELTPGPEIQGWSGLDWAQLEPRELQRDLGTPSAEEEGQELEIGIKGRGNRGKCEAQSPALLRRGPGTSCTLGFPKPRSRPGFGTGRGSHRGSGISAPVLNFKPEPMGKEAK